MGVRRTALSVLAVGLGVVAATVPLATTILPVGAQGTAIQVDTPDIEVNDLRISFSGYPGGGYDFGEVIESSCCGGAGANASADMYLKYPGAVRASQSFSYQWCIASISTSRSFGGYEHGIDRFTFDGIDYAGTSFGTQFGTTTNDYNPDVCRSYTATAPATPGASVATSIPGKSYSFRIGAGLAGSPIIGPNGPIGFNTASGTSPDRTVNLNVFTAPSAADDGVISVPAGGSTSAAVLANDSIGTGTRPGTVTGLSIAAAASNGTCTISGSSVAYVNNGTSGPDQCTYRWNQAETDDEAPSNGTVQAVVRFSVDSVATIPGAVYVPVTPCRAVDTRIAGGKIASLEVRDFVIVGTGAVFAAQGGKAGGCGVPEGAVAVETSVAAVSPTARGYFRAYPADEAEPTATFLNYAKGQDITNTGTIPLASSGATDLKVRNFTGASHYVIDIQGYFIDPSLIEGAVYVPVTPCRVVDTRIAGGKIASLESREYAIRGGGAAIAAQGGKAGGCGVPAGAVAVETSVASVSPTRAGFLRAYPADQPEPTATFLNYAKGQDITNTGTIPLASSGATDLELRNFTGASHYVIDIQGYFIDPSVEAGSRYLSVSPCRVVDTRIAGGKIASLASRAYAIRGAGSAIAAQGGKAGGCGVPADAVAVEASVAAVSPTTAGFLRAYPSDEAEPNATFLNYAKTQDITNTGSVPLAALGVTDLKLRNFTGASHYVIDVQGYFGPATPPA